MRRWTSGVMWTWVVCVCWVVAAASARSVGNVSVEAASRTWTLPSLETNCILLQDCTTIPNAVVTDKEQFAANLEELFGNCNEWALGMEQEHCETFIEYAYLSVRKDELGQDCLTPEAFRSICNMMVKLFPSRESLVGTPSSTVLQAADPPVAVIPATVQTSQRLAQAASRREQSQGESNADYLSICPGYPAYATGTVAFPICARMVCATYLDMPHVKAWPMKTCCESYKGNLGYWWEKYCWFTPDEDQ